MKDGHAHGVKLEGGAEMVPQIRRLVDGGVPVCAHIGFTPQSEHTLGGYRIQGRGDAAKKTIDDALAVQEAGAFAVVMEMVPGDVATEITSTLRIPTIGIGAGAGTDAQVLVWQDMMGLNAGRLPRFVKTYADLRTTMLDAARAYVADVEGGSFPGEEHTFQG
jgi:3-methyl-2-oxobutanoate hydroxymethyltransferase